MEITPQRLLTFLLLTSLGVVCACGGASQESHPKPSFNTPIQHVIIVIQENRSIDNLFGSDLQNHPRRLPDADLAAQGSCYSQSISLTAWTLNTCWDPDHGHSKPYPSWSTMYDGGKMDGACDIYVHSYCQSSTSIPPNPQYTFVDNSPIAATGVGLIEPYFQIAQQYGFANYMFQTNQGPSFPAHLFLFSGTSAPVYYNDPGDTQMFWQWFAAEELSVKGTGSYGCLADAGAVVYESAPDGTESPGYTPPGQTAGYPCYEHPTLTDLLEASEPPITWRYYGDSKPSSLFNAPNAISHICVPGGGACTGPNWTTDADVTVDSAQILTDISNCQLRQVNWVIPDGNWSDHPGAASADGGPSWVAAIVNAIGNSWSASNHQCDYWGNNTNEATAILVTWDDWGGFYDHINPGSRIGIGFPGAAAYSQQYVYGFRVPLLVISAYAQQAYISPLNHDFGSILNFTEHVFGQNNKSLGEISPAFHYADYYAQDAGAAPNDYSLYDFFDFTRQPRTFTPITGAKYPANCFTNPTAVGCFSSFPMDPDNDAVEGEN